MIHKNEQDQIFYILKRIDYSQKWEKIEYNLGYDLGDHLFPNHKTYQKVKDAAKNLWVVFNGHLNSEGQVI